MFHGSSETSTWKVTLSPPAFRDLSEMVLGVVNHEMAVDDPAGAVDQRRDRLEDDGADRDRLDEVTVPDVEVEDARARVQQVIDLLAET